jgi:hypothetical protein
MPQNTYHPWSLFARGVEEQAVSTVDSKQERATHKEKSSEDPCHLSDEDDDIPTVALLETSSTIAPNESHASLMSHASAYRSGNESEPRGRPSDDSLRGGFEKAGASESLIHRVEDMIMDHFYQVEASVFKLECGLKEQIRQSQTFSERLCLLEHDQHCDRARLEQHTQGGTFESERQTMSESQEKLGTTIMDANQKGRVLQDLRQDFDEQMARHEERFSSFEQAIRQSSLELASLRRDVLCIEKVASAHQPYDVAARSKECPQLLASVPTFDTSSTMNSSAEQSADVVADGCGTPDKPVSPNVVEMAQGHTHSFHRPLVEHAADQACALGYPSKDGHNTPKI